MNEWDALDARFGTAAPAATDDWDSLDKRVRQMSARAPEKPKPEPVTDFSGTLRFGPFDTGIQLPEGVNRRLAQLGSGFADWTTRIDQMRGKATEADVDAKRVRDRALNDDFTGKALNFAGKAVPSFAVPYAAGAPIMSGLAGGAVIGAMEPVGTGDSAIANTAMGAGFGAAVPAAFKAFQIAARPAPDALKDVATANKYGIPVGVADVSKNGFVKGARSFTNDLPLIGMPGQRLKDAQEAAFNRAVGKTFGEDATRLTPDVLDAAKSRMGGEFDRIWGRNDLVVDAALFSKLQQLQASVADMPRAQAQRLSGEIADFWNKMTQGQNGQVVVKGEAANKFQQWLRKQADGSDGYMRDSFNDLRQTIIGSFNRSISPQDAAALTTNRAQYKAFKTVEDLLNKGAVGTAGRSEGVVPPALLPERVRASYGNVSSQTSPPPLVELAGMGSRLLADRTPQMGGTPRAALQNMGIGAGLGIGGASVAPTTTALGAGAGLGINYLLNSPRVARAVLGAGKKRGLLDTASLDDMIAETLLLGGVRAPLAAPGLLLPASE